MAIGVDGQYIFIFTIGDKKDFIAESELQRFTLIEEVGNNLPTFQLAFYTLDESIYKYFNENNDLKVSFGKNRDTLEDAVLQVTNFHTNSSSNNKRLINAIGLYSANSYRANPKIFLSANKSGIEVIKDIATANKFKVISNIDKSLDSQVWIQPNISDKKFINEIWMHSHLNNSFPAIGITSGGKFIIKDIVKDQSAPIAFNFTRNVKDDIKDISYDGDYNTEVDSGMVNMFAGNGREQITYNLEDGTEESLSDKPAPIISMTNLLSRKAGVQAKFVSAGIQNDNIHENYHRAALKNFTSLVSFGGVRLSLSFQSDFKNVKVLDRVTFRDDDISENRVSASEFNSGIYYVCKVSRTLYNRTFNTVVILCRESLNNLREL